MIAEASELAWRRGLLAEGLAALNDARAPHPGGARLRDEAKTLEDLSQIYGVSRERVRQIEARAFEKLQKAMLAAGGSARRPRPSNTSRPRPLRNLSQRAEQGGSALPVLLEA